MAEELTRPALLGRLTELIVSVRRPHPLRVALDGPDAAGKTTLADELTGELVLSGRGVIGASIDGFHRPRSERYRQGPDSPRGYYEDSFDYPALRSELLDPLGPKGSRRYRRRIFDFRSDEACDVEIETAPDDAILLFDGVFLQRPELRDLWDLTIYVSVAFVETLRRALERDRALLGTADEVERRYRTRYGPGQELYVAGVRPEEIADVVVYNDEPSRPSLRVGT